MLNSCKQAPEQKTVPEDRMQWWNDAKFGMFIHWGVYSVPAGFYQEKPVTRYRRMDYEQG